MLEEEPLALVLLVFQHLQEPCQTVAAQEGVPNEWMQDAALSSEVHSSSLLSMAAVSKERQIRSDFERHTGYQTEKCLAHAGGKRWWQVQPK